MLLLFCLLILQWTVLNANLICDKNVTNIATGETITDVNKFCKDKPCINIYCEKPDTIFIRINKTEMCLTPTEISNIINKTLEFSKVDKVYKKDYSHEPKLSSKNLRNDFQLISYPKLTNSNCTERWIFSSFYILEDGSLLWDYGHQSPRYTVSHQGEFILSITMRQRKTGAWVGPMLAIKMLKTINPEIEDHRHAFYNAIGMLVSCFFLIILFIIYCMFRQLRNLAGIILMAYVASFTVGILLKAAQIFAMLNKAIHNNGCLYTSIIQYFGLMSSFFWMNVMSFDIWWTFRGSIKSRPINRRGIMHKFSMYCLYAFGVPFLMTVGATIIDIMKLENMKDIKKPIFNHCMNSKNNTFLYVYVPIIIIVFSNIILFLMTSINIWRLKRASEKMTNTSESRTNKKEQNRFFLYIRLSLITGVHWLLDIIDVLVDEDMPSWLEYIANMYNTLIGVFIFAIFICKKHVLYLICHKFSILNKFTEKMKPNKSLKSTMSTSRCSNNDKRNDSASLEPLNSTVQL